MERLTIDNPNSRFETMMNYCYDSNGEALLQYADGEEEVNLVDYTVNCCREKGCYTTHDEILENGLECDCPVAIMYYLGAQAVEIRGRLKQYEDIGLMPDDAEELLKAKQEGRLVVLPCKVGDTVRAIVLRPYNGHEATIRGVVTDVQNVVRVEYSGCSHINFLASDFGKTVFLIKEEAEAALKEREINE